jgi:hypothetical protein
MQSRVCAPDVAMHVAKHRYEMWLGELCERRSKGNGGQFGHLN